MRKKLRWSCVALAALAVLLGYGFFWNSAMSEDAKGHLEDAKAIKQAMTAYSDAFNRGDVDGLLAHWSPDADYIDESGKTTRGRAAIADLLRKNQEHLKGHKMKLEGTGLRFVTRDVALADGKATLASPDGTEDVTPFVAVWVKSKDKWLVKSLRDLVDDTANEPETATDHLSHLEPLLGHWVSTDKGADVNFHCRWTLNKNFLLAEYTVKRGDQETSTAQRFGWDPVNQQIRSWYFDSVGGYGESAGDPESDGWVAEATGILPDGRIGTATQSIHFIDEKSFVFQSRNRTVDGRPLADIVVHFVRKSGKE
jgi:uncharacterized protein (TIGR02246 family)